MLRHIAAVPGGYTAERLPATSQRVFHSLRRWIEMAHPSSFQRQSLHVMAKPIGPICNLDCAYCYYLGKEGLYPRGERWRMPDATLETYIRQLIETQPAQLPEIHFAWQGGEPTLLGLPFFRHVVELQHKYAPAGRRVVNSLQTNGVLLDDEWCQFFREHRFLIGLSIDGPAELHDHYRVDKQGRGTFDDVLRALKCLARHEVEHNALVVVNRLNGDQGGRIYRFLRQAGVRYVQFIPIVEKLDHTGQATSLPQSFQPLVQKETKPEDLVSPRSVLPHQWGSFLCEVFDLWVERDVGRIFVQIFDEALASFSGLEPSLCVFRRQCGRALALEHNGDLYSCDHFVEPAYRLGNILELPIVELANSPRQQQFGLDKEATLPGYCRRCEVRFACHGECPKNRFVRTPDGEPGLNYLCAGYKQFFLHIAPIMRAMAERLRRGLPPAGVMHELRVARASASPTNTSGTAPVRTSPRRNDPCPCGSGRKFKQCCGR